MGSPKYKKRVFVVGTDRDKLYHLMSIAEKPDGSIYCFPNESMDVRGADHTSYHGSGEIHIKMGSKKVDSAVIVPPAKLDRIVNFPGVVAHMNLLMRAEPLSDTRGELQKFKPTTVVYVDLTTMKDSSVNVHAFAFPPKLIDYIKTPFLFNENVKQFQLITDVFPWIGIYVSTTQYSMSGPPVADFSNPDTLQGINKLFQNKYASSVTQT